MTPQERYREWSAQQTDLPVFAHGWWLDAACGEKNWDAILVEENGAIVATFPYYLKKRGPFSLIAIPRLTQTLGPHIVYPHGISHSDRLSLEKKTLTAMIQRLPRYDHCRVKASYRLTNWLPFYWAGFQQQTAYTYVIPDLTNLESVLANFDYSKRKDINKAKKAVEPVFNIGAEAFYRNLELTFGKRGAAVGYSFEIFRRLHDAALAHNSGCTIGAKDRDGNLHAALFIVWSKEAAYDLVSTIDPDFRNSGAATLLVQEAIRHVSTFTDRFDFEGSMIEGVEASFRKFGTVQTPYFVLTRTPSLLLRLRAAAMFVVKGSS